MFTFTNINDEKEVVYLAAMTMEDGMKWAEVFTSAFKDITEEHRSAVRSIDSQHKSLRFSTASDNILGLGKGTHGKGKSLRVGLSSIAMKKVKNINSGCLT
jgi:hypothetical protein